MTTTPAPCATRPSVARAPEPQASSDEEHASDPCSISRPCAPASRARATRRERSATWIGVLALTCFAFALRWCGLGVLLPHAPEIHERVWVHQLRALRESAGGAESPATHGIVAAREHQDFGYYPRLVPSVLAWLPPSAPPSVDASVELREHWHAASSDHLRLRALGALLSVLVVPASFFLARRFATATIAWLTAALAATSSLHEFFSVQARPHAAAAGLVALSLVALLRVCERPRVARYIVAGACVAAAIATLQSALALLTVLLCAHGLRLRDPGRARGLDWLGLSAALVLIGAAWLALGPAASPAQAPQPAVAHLVLAGHVIPLEALHGGGFATFARTLAWCEPLLLVALVLGALRAAFASRVLREHFRGRARGALLLSAYGVPYALVTGCYDGTLERFLLPLLPFLCLGAAAALLAGTRAGAWRVAALLLVAVQTARAGWLSFVRGADDTGVLAARWIEEHLDRSSAQLAFSPGTYVPLVRRLALYDATARDQDANPSGAWFPYQANLDPRESARFAWRSEFLALPDATSTRAAVAVAEERVGELDADYLVLAVWDGRAFPLRRPALERVRSAAAARGHCVARFSPWADGDPDPLPFDHYDVVDRGEPPFWFWRVLRARRAGPVIEIYALSR